MLVISLLSAAGVLLGPAASIADTGGSITEFPIAGVCCEAELAGITSGPDGNLWFTDVANDQVGKITPTGTASEVGVPSFPTAIAAGPDGNLWFIDQGAEQIGRITPSGTVTEFPIPSAISVTSVDPSPSGITTGPDGNIWFVDIPNNEIGRITPTGTIKEFTIPSTRGASSFPEGIATGPDGNLWFTEQDTNKIGRITPTGKITEFTVPTAHSDPFSITSGPDGNLWFTEQGADKIGRITVTGAFSEFPIPTIGSGPTGITAGPDGNLWFTEQNADKIGRISPAGTMTEVEVPSGGSPTGIATGPDGSIWFAMLEPNGLTGLVGRLNPTLAPTNTSPPTISGTTQQGQTLSEAHGDWSDSPTAFAYQWQDCDTSGNACKPISGANGQTYALTGSDAGHTIRVQESAMNVGGTNAPATSTQTAVVTLLPPPSSTSPPSISGTTQQGQTLSEAHGLWTDGPTAYSYQWQDCDAAGNACSPVSGATLQTYTLAASDVGHTIRVEEIASNASGNGAPATSASTGVVQVPPGTSRKPPSASGGITVRRVTVSGPLVSVRVSCTGRPGSACKLHLRLMIIERVKAGKVIGVTAENRRKPNRKVVVLGTASLSLSAGETKTVRLSLNGTGKRLLAKHHALKAKVAITNWGKTVSTKIITFKAKPKKRKPQHASRGGTRATTRPPSV